MMKYYRVYTSSDPKIIGVKNGVMQGVIDERSFKSVKHFKEFQYFFSYKKYWTHDTQIYSKDDGLEGFSLLNGAFITDFISYGEYIMGCPFILSAKAKSLFDRFNLPLCQFFPIGISNYSSNTENEGFYLFNCPMLDFDKIDFSQSTIYSGNDLLGKEYLNIANSSEYKDALQEYSILSFQSLCLKDELEKDLFNTRFAGLYISENLRDEIVSLGLSGVNIKSESILELF